MKKFIKFLVVVLSVFILTGCVSENDRNDILDYMVKEKLIDKNWKLVDTVVTSYYSTEFCITSSYDYIYENGNDKIMVKIYGNKYDGYNFKSFTVELFNVIREDELVEIPENSNGCNGSTYQDGSTYKNNKYVVGDKGLKKYKIDRTKQKKFIGYKIIWGYSELNEDSN